MKILALGSRPPDALGGAERSLARLMMRLARTHEVLLAVPGQSLPCDPGPQDGQPELVALPETMEPEILERILCKRIAAGWKPDILVTFDKGCFKNPGILEVLRRHLPDTPLVVKESTEGKFRRLLSETLPPAQGRYVLENIHRMVCVSKRVRANFEEANLFPGRLVDIPNGVDTNRFHPVTPAEKIRIRQSLGLPDEKMPLFLVAGRFAEKKNLDMVFGAWFDLERRLGNFGFLLLLGAPHKAYDVPLLDLFRRELKNVRIVAPVQKDENLARWYQACDFLLAPTSREGLSNVCLEGMSSGLFPVVSRASGYEDLVQGAETGLLVEERNTSQLIRAMELILKDPASFSERGRTHARQVVVSGYDLTLVAQHYEALFQDCLQELSQQ
ncbi:MAG: glycosyltransferase family 4 protein [Magnetococcales bacterium]|nr:glycosyltransferase family 4 protein [Magnetococcales bacterium]NGZ26490.1 glycosyltransferase family 4 protein [Magnetococcales bacterium]